jgi:hypothetical protein
VSDINTALAQAKRRTMRDNPQKFQPRSVNGVPRAPMVDMDGSPGAPSGGRTWNDLKPEYRQIAEKDIARGQYTKETYLANCDASAFRR